MRILFVTTEYPPFVIGGLGVYSGNVVREMSKRHNVTVLCPGPENRRYGGNPEVIRVESEIYGYNSDNTFLYGSIRAISGMEFDVAVCNDVHTAKIGLSLIERGVPVVFILHRSSYRDSPSLFRLEKDIIRKADAVVTVSNLMKRMFAPESFVIHNACDDHADDVSSDHILVISRNSFEKNLSALSNLSGLGVPVYVIGSGTETISMGNVRGLGYVDEMTKKDLISRAMFVFHPADIEPFGISILEAVYSGKPVVCLGEAGAAEVVPVLKGWKWVWKLLDKSELERAKAMISGIRKRRWSDVAHDLELVLKMVLNEPAE